MELARTRLLVLHLVAASCCWRPRSRQQKEDEKGRSGRWLRSSDSLLIAVASWPDTVVPHLQHIGFTARHHMPDLAPIYEPLLAHRPQRITCRPMHPFCVHLFNEACDLLEPHPVVQSEELQLPCVRLHVPEWLTPDSIDEDLLRQMDAAAATIACTKAELLAMVQAEQLRVNLQAEVAAAGG